MTRRVIREGITLVGVKSVSWWDKQEAADRAYAEELYREREIDRELREWLANPANREDINYSDIFKDVYGVRP